MPHLYNAPPLTPSTIGEQATLNYYYKKALVETMDDLYFTPLADVRAMPKNFGKEIVQYVYIPLLDERNVNDQGINAAGVTIANGNLYGSSKDIGTIPANMPVLTEAGGRVNRVGFTRKLIKGSLREFGFFYEYSQDAMDFDSDEELESHISRECLRGAQKIVEDNLQIDLVNAAGTVLYAGTATSTATVKDTDILTYNLLLRLGLLLDDNHTPKKTTIISGTRMVDTRTISSARVLLLGSALVPTLRAMKDLHGSPAFVPVHQYAAGTEPLNGEIGAIDQFRIIQVPNMLEWTGGGAASSNPLVASSNGKVNVYPLLTIGAEAFTTIGFQTSGKTVKFKIIHKKPGEATADKTDPYGKLGFGSIQWFYGFMALRAERIGLIKTAAKY